MKWACGLTTVPERSKLLKQTLASVKNAGFTVDRLFVDGGPNGMPDYHATIREPKISITGNWLLGVLELYIREPHADRYAMFQDDVLMCRNLRQYLESCEYPWQSYLNLYTMPQNLLLSGGKNGWYASNQMGRGALALVFNREGLMTVLEQSCIWKKFQDTKPWMMNGRMHEPNGHRSIDGILLTAMKQRGWKEYVHNPSLVQHLGRGHSTLGNREWDDADSFPGEQFDATTLVTEKLG